MTPVPQHGVRERYTEIIETHPLAQRVRSALDEGWVDGTDCAMAIVVDLVEHIAVQDMRLDSLRSEVSTSRK